MRTLQNNQIAPANRLESSTNQQMPHGAKKSRHQPTRVLGEHSVRWWKDFVFSFRFHISLSTLLLETKCQRSLSISFKPHTSSWACLSLLSLVPVNIFIVE